MTFVPAVVQRLALETPVATGDTRNIVLWIVLAVLALGLLILSSVLSANGKKKDKNKNKKS